ncbi:NAD(P)-dependent oxidoreductase [Croceivirga thetidis]|uniref:3-phosphoglycerate dehydrogenase n=1 Tax=Croceivirga thetidis TaxID=2721623 RepID=A0ABX1GU01_9FLAO|nr:NAD(P)-dependent oxidoreductase [Croceivirga thetidis]NKI32202.1 3-phosphoglycerate dehydrogenase [Croceivirga thetidis]
MKVLANDGISNSGKEKLTENGFELIETKVAQEQLVKYINENNIVALLVRSATQVKKDVIDGCPNLKLIGRGGVGMDNIDVDYAESKGIHVINTPNASSDSVAELVFAHIFSGSRFLYDSNRNMPLEGDSKFKALKKSYANSTEIKGKTIGIIGFGRIGRAVAKRALGLGMAVIFHDSHHQEKQTIRLEFIEGKFLEFVVKPKKLDELLSAADFISIHLPAQKNAVIGEAELSKMKTTSGIINTSRGGLIDEVALVDALDNGKLAFAGLDVFEDEPSPAIKVLMNPRISLSPHIGGSTLEAQQRIGLELANQMIEILK